MVRNNQNYHLFFFVGPKAIVYIMLQENGQNGNNMVLGQCSVRQSVDWHLSRLVVGSSSAIMPQLSAKVSASASRISSDANT